MVRKIQLMINYNKEIYIYIIIEFQIYLMNVFSKPINDTDATNKLVNTNTNNTNKVFIKKEDILNYKDWEKSDTELSAYTLKDLKPICKYYKLRCSGKKKDIIDRIEDFFKKTIYSIKIQSFWRRKIVLLNNNLRGPALYNRIICANEVDFNTLEPLSEIDNNSFFSYIENVNNNEYIWGFNFYSIIELLNNQSIPKNPFNRSELSKENINNILRLFRINNILFPKKIINTNDDFNLHTLNIPDEYNIIGLSYGYYRPKCFNKSLIKSVFNRSLYINICKKRTSNIDERIRALFYTFDSYGNYTTTDWFYQLDFNKLVTFYKQLFSIWNNSRNSIIPTNIKRKICVLFDPFQALFRGTIIYNRNDHDKSMFTMRVAVVTIIENMIYASIDEEYSKLGVLHCLTAFTIVSHPARTTLPWLWESVQ